MNVFSLLELTGPTSKTYIQTGFRNESREKSILPSNRSINSIMAINEEKVLEKPVELQERITQTDMYKKVMALYGEHRGMTAKEHATICLQVANSFKVRHCHFRFAVFLSLIYFIKFLLEKKPNTIHYAHAQMNNLGLKQ